MKALAIALAPYHFCHCRVERKRARIRRMKYLKTPVAILAALSTSFALAEDFKTIEGKEYKNAKVSRVEADGIVLITKSGISKVYFVELRKEIQERLHYDAQQGAQCKPMLGKPIVTTVAPTFVARLAITGNVPTFPFRL
jgi:hypothetical protein